MRVPCQPDFPSYYHLQYRLAMGHEALFIFHKLLGVRYINVKTLRVTTVGYITQTSSYFYQYVCDYWLCDGDRGTCTDGNGARECLS